jgi:hypothetical protein
MEADVHRPSQNSPGVSFIIVPFVNEIIGEYGKRLSAVGGGTAHVSMTCLSCPFLLSSASTWLTSINQHN